MRKATLLSLIYGLAVAASHVSTQLVHAQQFSADIQRMDADQPSRIIGKLNVAEGNVRIQTFDIPNGFFIVREDSNTAYFVRPGLRTFMDARRSSELTRVFVQVDPNNPCQQWQAMTDNANGGGQSSSMQSSSMQCKRIGNESIDGRDATKYHVLSTQGRWYFAWIDEKLRFVLKYQVDDGATFTIANIEEISQPQDLFEIPDSYQKFDPQKLIDRIKQSDVWVDPIR
jgi:hypothetical protein